jgi:DNA topoisomerase-1
VAIAQSVPGGLHSELLGELPIVTDPVQSARQAGLRYVNDERPGIRRKRAGKHFSYIGLDGRPIQDPTELKRIKSLAIPPAWTNVWISPRANGHILATGRDAKGRKQYKYHPRWREVRDETKYYRMVAFGEALPCIRERVSEDMSQRGLTRERVVATMVRLLDETSIRVGNEEYARQNASYGLTTLQADHVEVTGSLLHFHFVGKAGKEHIVDVRDRRVARIVRQCQDLPGHELFHFLDSVGKEHHVGSQDVNDYLREITGQDFTAKDFRTWHGTVVAACSLYEGGAFETETEAKKHVTQAIEAAAQHLGNTPAICRKSYVHPGVIDAYMNRTLAPFFEAEAGVRAGENELQPEERAVLALLCRQFGEEMAGQRAAS